MNAAHGGLCGAKHDTDVAVALLERARDDVRAVRAVLAIADVTDGIVGFHAQQSVEKALKAVLAVSGIAFPFTHDIEGLIERELLARGGCGDYTYKRI